ncbi:MAG TPA: DUF167 domain-containing protein [Acidimicrobiales bacterium]|nr:DUF167 domain-containing protein [Acidimicrobiales bacterium]
MRVSLRVQPGARTTQVGGRYGTTEPPILIVRVPQPAREGKANNAVLDALADAFDVPRRAVRLISGPANRSKIVDIDGADPAVLDALLSR